MIIRGFLLVCLLIISGVMIAQEQTNPPVPDETKGEPPVRLKKKKTSKPSESESKPMAEESSQKKKNSEDDPSAKKEKNLPKEKDKDQIRDDMEEEEILGRIGKNVKDVDDRLGNLDLGDPTLQKQRDILEDLEKLLRKNQNEQSESKQSKTNPSSKSETRDQDSKNVPDQSSSSKDSGKDGVKQKQDGSARKQDATGMQQEKKQGPSVKGDPGMGEVKPKDSQGGGKAGGSNSEKTEPSNPGKSGAKESKAANGGGGDSSKDKVNPAADVFKNAWGHLPETLRAELDAFGMPNQFMDRYDEMIRKYYSKVAEKGGRKKQ